MNDATPPAGEEVIACRLLERELAERGNRLAHELFPGARSIEELPDGYAFDFAADEEWTARVLDFVAFERRCCPFFTFEVVFEPHGRALWLRLRGSAEIKEFIRDTFPVVLSD
jgi:hypothetical protein